LKENIELTENEIQDAIIYITDEENKKNRIEEINSKIETTIHKLNTLSLFSKISNQEIKIFLTNKLESEILVLKNTIEEKLENIVSEY
jgi:alanine racemase